MGERKQCGCELAENSGHFANKLTIISPAKNYDF